jgi:hypothetical protein
MGTLGVTRGAANELTTGTFGSATGSSVPSQAAGVLGPGLPAVAGQALNPFGNDDTPGVAWTDPSPVHVAPGPECGHCVAPAGTVTRATSTAAARWHCVRGSRAGLSTTVQEAETEGALGPMTGHEAGAAAMAPRVSWFTAITMAVAR